MINELNELKASQARVAIVNLTLEDARKAKAAIEALIAKWEPDHAYSGCQVYNLSAVVGAPGLQTWLAHFQTKPSGQELPDIIFEIGPDGSASLAAFRSFFAYQFAAKKSEVVAAQSGGEA